MGEQDKEKGLEGIPPLAKILADRIKQIAKDSSPESYTCEECRDQFWIPFTDKDGAIRHRKCKCVIAKEAKEKLERSGLAGYVDEKTFDSFQADTPLQQQMKKKALEYVDAVFKAKEERSPRVPWFFIGGSPGSGKTHICTAICGEFLKRNIGVKYMKWLDESRRLKYSVNDEDFDELVADYINIPVLYIDDLFKQKYTNNPVFTDADIKIAFTILDARYTLNKPTIISTEWDLIDHLIAADQGVFSRAYERCKGFMLTVSRKMENNYRMRGIEE